MLFILKKKTTKKTKPFFDRKFPGEDKGRNVCRLPDHALITFESCQICAFPNAKAED